MCEGLGMSLGEMGLAAVLVLLEYQYLMSTRCKLALESIYFSLGISSVLFLPRDCESLTQ